MCQVCTEAAHSVALWTRTLSQVWTCVKYVPKQPIPQHFQHERYHRFGHVSNMFRSSPFRSILNMNVTTGLDMCQVCTEAAHSVALWARTLPQVWTCVKYVPKQTCEKMGSVDPPLAKTWTRSVLSVKSQQHQIPRKTETDQKNVLLKHIWVTVGSRSTITHLGTCLPAPVSEKNLPRWHQENETLGGKTT